jgi:hypothetical protein
MRFTSTIGESQPQRLKPEVFAAGGTTEVVPFRPGMKDPRLDQRNFDPRPDA